MKEDSPKIRTYLKIFSRPGEHQEVLKDLKMSAEFDMRYRGFFEFYGSDLIAYKKTHRSKAANEFLTAFSNFLTDTLEDYCPSSWEECYPPFWEEFIFIQIPLFIKLTPKRNQFETFLCELKRFVRWLDKRVKTSWYQVVSKFIEEAPPYLKPSEDLLNELFLMHFPNILKDDWDVKKDAEKVDWEFHLMTDRLDSIFEIAHIEEDIVLLTELRTQRRFLIQGLPTHSMYSGMLLDGIIAKQADDLFWKWLSTTSVFPARAKKHIIFA